MHSIQQFIQFLSDSCQNNIFVKLTLSIYQGKEEGLKNCFIKRVTIKNEHKLSFTFRYKTRDIVKNYSLNEAITIITDFLSAENFKMANLFTLNTDVVLEIKNNHQVKIKQLNPSHQELPSTIHNKTKSRLIQANQNSFLHALKICDERGVVYPHAQDKFKQINRYVEILKPLIENLPKNKVLNVADMGSGKGYLTFALYDYMSNHLQLKINMIGIEFRKDMVSLCNNIARQSNFENLKFEENSIIDYTIHQIDVLIALHACDTATDEAICKGIQANAKLIVVAPCCHKQIRKEIEKSNHKSAIDFLLKHGVFMERQAEMLTDGLRAMILEYFDYSTKVFEFISDAHTPKNVMIIAERKPKTKEQKQFLYSKIQEAKAFFGVKQHHLEKLMEM
ncbi:MAG: SAM-dependent methyltransferase [Bacteroidia bacterium]|nr:SAM-dependent methyltransferase [Bacteroidia bacterium]